MEHSTPATFTSHCRKHWRALVAIATAILALRILSLATSCAMDKSLSCSDWFYYGMLGPLRFQWIAKYKELIAGIAAAGAATLVILAAKIQVDGADKARLNAERNEIKATLRVLAQAMRAVASSYASSVSRELISKLVDANQPPSNFRIKFPIFMVSYQMHMMNIAFLAEEIRTNDSSKKSKITKMTNTNLVKSKLIAEILDHIYNSNTFIDLDEISKLKPSKSVCEDVKRTKVTASDIGAFWTRFEWPNNLQSDIKASGKSRQPDTLTNSSHGSTSTSSGDTDVSQPGM